MNQCWNIVNSTLTNKFQWNVNRNSCIFIRETAFENVVCEMAVILSRPPCVKIGNIWRVGRQSGRYLWGWEMGVISPVNTTTGHISDIISKKCGKYEGRRLHGCTWPLLCWIHFRKTRLFNYIFYHFSISQHCNGTDCWNPASGIVNTMAADTLAPCVARLSAAIVLV